MQKKQSEGNFFFYHANLSNLAFIEVNVIGKKFNSSL